MTPSIAILRVRGITTPCSCCGDQLLSFDLVDGSVLRLRLTQEHRTQLWAYLGAAFPEQGVRCQTCCQSGGAV